MSYANTLRQIFETALKALGNSQFDQPIESFKQIIVLKPDFAQAYNYLGLAYQGKGDNFINESISAFEKATQLSPQYPDPYENLGKIYYGHGDMAKAEKYCLKAIELNPQDVIAQVSLGWIYLMGKNQPRAAIRYFKKSINKTANPYAYLGLGFAYLKDEQHDSVLEMITGLRKLGREDFAKELEHMNRMGRYIPTHFAPFDVQMPQSAAGQLISDEASNYNYSSSSGNASRASATPSPDIANMQVHLKGKWGDDDAEDSAGQETAAERIRELQQNNQRKATTGY